MNIELTVRTPKFDFSAAPVVWSKNPEFAMIWNAMSTGAPSSEIYLNQVMMRALKAFGPGDREIYKVVEDFIKQESNHYRIHMMFNRQLYAAGYDMMKPAENAMKEDLRVLFEKKSLNFNLAYCAGFENFTLFTSNFAFESAQDLFVGGNPATTNLWLWHLAEEYEHRSVCHDVFKTLSGNYFLRIYGLLYSFVHLNSYIGKVAAAFLAKYREGMTEAERLASIKREKSYKRRYALYAFPRMLAILVPFYNPATAKPSPKLQSVLQSFSGVSA